MSKSIIADEDDLFFDLETGYHLVRSWRIGRDLNIDHNCIKEEARIICISWMWGNETKPHHLKWDYNAPEKDQVMLEKFSKVYTKANRLIAQNGKSFDLKWFRTRVLDLDLDPLPEIEMFDTLSENRKWFRHASNKLDYLSKKYGGGGKNPMVFDDWIQVVEHNNRSKLKQMVYYCDKDVLDLRLVFNKIYPHIPKKRSKGHMKGDEMVCDCGLTMRKWTIATNKRTGIRRQRWYCNDCRSTATDTREYKDERR